MKKNLLWTLLAALTWVGCSDDELMESGGNGQNSNAVTFDTYVSGGAQSRATVVDNNTLKTEGFGVNAWYTKDKGFNDEGVTKEAFMTITGSNYVGEIVGYLSNSSDSYFYIEGCCYRSGNDAIGHHSYDIGIGNLMEVSDWTDDTILQSAAENLNKGIDNIASTENYKYPIAAAAGWHFVVNTDEATKATMPLVVKYTAPTADGGE